MDLSFHDDPNLVPRPREEIQILELNAVPYPDGRRVRIELMMSAFAPQDRPNLEILVELPEYGVLASANIVESTQHAITLTMHLRDVNVVAQGDYILRANLSFEAGVIQHTLERRFQLIKPATGDEDIS